MTALLTADQFKLLSNDEFKALVKAHHVPADVKLRKQYICDSIKKAPGSDPARRIYRWTISTDLRDRDGDTLNPNGWHLEGFKKGGVVPFAHDYHSLPVATPVMVSVIDGKLVSDADFTDTADIYPFADMVARMVEKNILRCASVGFAPITYVFNEPANGMDYNEQELLEWSIVPVPSNPDALLQAKALGIDVMPYRTWAEEALDYAHGDDAGAYITKTELDELEQVVKMLKTKKTISGHGKKPKKDTIAPANPAPADGSGVAVCPRGAACPLTPDQAIENCALGAECPFVTQDQSGSPGPAETVTSGDHDEPSANPAPMSAPSGDHAAAMVAPDLKALEEIRKLNGLLALPAIAAYLLRLDAKASTSSSTDDGKMSTDDGMCGTTGLNPLSTAAENMDHERSAPLFIDIEDHRADEIVLDLVEEVTKTYDIDKGELANLLRHTIAEAITEAVQTVATREVDRHRGRISD